MRSLGYVRGDVDTFITGIFNVLLSVPGVVMALALVAFLQGSADEAAKSGIPAELILIIAIGVVSIPLVGRIARASALELVAARVRARGSRARARRTAGSWCARCCPTSLPAMFSIALLGIAVAIVAEGTLSILGVGVRPPTPSWGNIIAQERGNLFKSPHIVFEPSILIFLTVLSLNFLGDVVRSRFDVREAGILTDSRFTEARARRARCSRSRTSRPTSRPTAGSCARSTASSFTLDRGKTLGIVGESGSGKTVLVALGHGPAPQAAGSRREGSVRFEGTRASSACPQEDMRAVLGLADVDDLPGPDDVAEPGDEGREADHRVDPPAPRRHPATSRTSSPRTCSRRSASPSRKQRLKEYPHQLSGGMRQRVCIAVALACGPKLLFADEPTTALDVTVQAQVLDLMSQQQRERFMAMVLITHDLGVVAGRADEIAVMYAGRIVEKAPTSVLFRDMKMPYTEALLSSIPKLADPSHTRLATIPGRPPDLLHPPPGCKFAARCAYVQDRCIEEEPPLTDGPSAGHQYRCWFPVGTPEGKERSSATWPPARPPPRRSPWPAR